MGKIALRKIRSQYLIDNGTDKMKDS